MPHHLRFFFEYGVDTPLWPGPSGLPDLDSPYGHPCAPEKPPVTAATGTELTRRGNPRPSPGGGQSCPGEPAH
ncbi:hypothetical protein ABT237_15990 [Streptomyces sp. NPDC001581]|uniref:hypothetical protein n=1 Tax=Streptomyces sp. NPDC001581 TaxID=3154386 RepID=UPI00331CDE57